VLVTRGAVMAAASDVACARTLGGEDRYQDAWELLLPFGISSEDGMAFNLLPGEAALRAKRAERARSLFERSLAVEYGSTVT